MSLLEVIDLTTHYGDVQVLWNISIAVEYGELVSLVGPNAAGKTTLIHTISGILGNSSGQVVFNNQTLNSMPAYRRVELGLVQVPEGKMLFPFMSVKENLEMGAFVPEARRDKDQTMSWIFELFPVLKTKQKQLAGLLSGGEQQMCALARGLMAKPKLLMLDEPTLGLAPLMVQEVFHIIEQLKKENITIILVEQNVRHTLQISDRSYVIENGRIVLEGSGQDLLTDDRLRKAYMGI